MVGSSADFVEVAVSEPKMMLPKLTPLYIPPSLPDGEIISGILDKNPQIKELLNARYTLTLVFSRVRDGKKMVVIKMSHCPLMSAMLLLIVVIACSFI